jgi:hypothetical protein
VARKRPMASNVVRPMLTCLDGGRPDRDTPAPTLVETIAARRSAAVTHKRLVAHLTGVATVAAREAKS